MTAVSDRVLGTLEGLNPDQAAQAEAYIDLLDDDSRDVPDVYRWTNPLPGVALTVPELGLLARVFDQDDANLPCVQKGLEDGAIDQVTFAEYQETKIRHFHMVLEQLLA